MREDKPWWLTERRQFFEDLIKDEINVKSITYEYDITKYADQKLSINHQKLGKRLPHKMKEIIAASKKNDWVLLGEQLQIAGEMLESNEFSIVLEPRAAKGIKSFPGGLVILDLEITKELEEEGIARDLVRFIQQARKDAGFNVSDHIELEIKGDEEITKILD